MCAKETIATELKTDSVVVRAHGHTRSTQSFVRVMAMVWKRPSLTGVEILWRWAFGVPLLVVVWMHGGRELAMHAGERAAAGAAVLHRGFVLGMEHRALALTIALLVVWCAFSVAGRRVLLRRLGNIAAPRWFSLWVIACVRVAVFSLFVAAWVALVLTITAPVLVDPRPLSVQSGIVSSFALIVVSTLLLFIVWALVGWVFRLAALIAAAEQAGALVALRRAAQSVALRGKLIEINLVMGIVKVALIVLAMVASACPLPFESVATPQFLAVWWTGVAVLYLAASDYFHVVRLAAYIALTESGAA